MAFEPGGDGENFTERFAPGLLLPDAIDAFAECDAIGIFSGIARKRAHQCRRCAISRFLPNESARHQGSKIRHPVAPFIWRCAARSPI